MSERERERERASAVTSSRPPLRPEPQRYQALALGVSGLAAPAWTPFARLTFGAYLFHPVAIKWFAGTATSTYHFSIHHVLSDAAFNAVCAFACAAVTWLVVERPTMSATSGLTSRRRAGA